MDDQNPDRNTYNPPENNHSEPLNSSKKKKSGKLNDTLSTFGVILLAPIVALFLTQFIFQSYQVDGPSMEQTLQNRDRLIVTKTGKTWARITGKDYIPKHNEIVIFNYSGESTIGQSNKKQLVKRVIGLPGDRVVVNDNLVTIYNSQHPQGFLVDREGPQRNTITVTTGNIDQTIRQGEVYVMGDNRSNSLDSRSFGPIPSKDVVGKLNLRIYPFDKADRF